MARSRASLVQIGETSDCFGTGVVRLVNAATMIVGKQLSRQARLVSKAELTLCTLSACYSTGMSDLYRPFAELRVKLLVEAYTEFKPLMVEFLSK